MFWGYILAFLPCILLMAFSLENTVAYHICYDSWLRAMQEVVSRRILTLKVWLPVLFTQGKDLGLTHLRLPKISWTQDKPNHRAYASTILTASGVEKREGACNLLEMVVIIKMRANTGTLGKEQGKELQGSHSIRGMLYFSQLKFWRPPKGLWLERGQSKIPIQAMWL